MTSCIYQSVKKAFSPQDQIPYVKTVPVLVPVPKGRGKIRTGQQNTSSVRGEGIKIWQTFLSIQIVWLNIEIVALGYDKLSITIVVEGLVQVTEKN
jgi:hypothetical protein